MLAFKTDNACNDLYHTETAGDCWRLGDGGTYNVIPMDSIRVRVSSRIFGWGGRRLA